MRGVWQRRPKAGAPPAGLVLELAGGMPELVRGTLRAIVLSDGFNDPRSVRIGHGFAGSVADPTDGRDANRLDHPSGAAKDLAAPHRGRRQELGLAVGSDVPARFPVDELYSLLVACRPCVSHRGCGACN